MWKMTLKQRRHHGELMAQLDKLKKDPYLHVPKGYEAGVNPEEDQKYIKAIEALGAVIDEIQTLEQAARER